MKSQTMFKGTKVLKIGGHTAAINKDRVDFQLPDRRAVDFDTTTKIDLNLAVADTESLAATSSGSSSRRSTPSTSRPHGSAEWTQYSCSSAQVP